MRRGRRPDERGAIAVMTGAVMVILLIVAAIVVDIGMQRVARRDMQAVADTVALDMARLIGSRTRAEIESGAGGFTPLATAKASSVARNAGNAVGNASDFTVDVYLVELVDDASDPDSARDNYAMSGGVPVQVAGGVRPTGVVVIARTSVDYGFAQIIGRDTGTASRSSVSSQSVPSVCFSVGAKSLTLDTNQSALSPLLSQILRVNLSAVGYEGLVDVKEVGVPLADLLVELNVASTDQLATTNVSLSTFIVAAADAMRANGNTVGAQALEAIRLGVPGSNVRLSDILALASGTPAAGLTTNINVFDAVTAAIIAANGQNAVTVGVPGVADVKIIEPPKVACGTRGISATSAQIQLHLKPTLPANAVPGLLGGTTDLTVVVGGARATIDADITCLPDTVTFRTETGAVSILPPVPPAQGQLNLSVTLNRFLSAAPAIGGLLAATLRLLGLSEVRLDVLLQAAIASAVETRTILYPAPPALPPKVTFPVDGIAKTLDFQAAQVFLSTGQGGLVSALGPLLSLVLNQVLTNLVTPIVDTVLDPTLTAIFNALTPVLGLRLGVADVQLMGRPVCQSVKLIG